MSDNSFHELLSLADTLRTPLSSILSDSSGLRGALAGAIVAAKKARKRYNSMVEAQTVLQAAAVHVQTEAQKQLAPLISMALDVVFDHPYTMWLTFEPKRGKSEAAIRFTRDGVDFDPMSETGGGAVDVAAFALRFALWRAQRQLTRPVFIFDEPFRFIMPELRDRLILVVRKLCEALGVQVVCVTHIKELSAAADKQVRVRKRKGRSIETS
jgi:ABC-type sugar transport system ATPase subunit